MCCLFVWRFDGMQLAGDNGGKVTLKAVTQFGGDDPAAELFSTIIEEWETDTGNSVTNDSAKADNV